MKLLTIVTVDCPSCDEDGNVKVEHACEDLYEFKYFKALDAELTPSSAETPE